MLPMTVFQSVTLSAGHGEAGNKTNGYATEVKMVPSTPDVPLPAHRERMSPDPTLVGYDWIQIGNEGGFHRIRQLFPLQPTLEPRPDNL